MTQSAADHPARASVFVPFIPTDRKYADLFAEHQRAIFRLALMLCGDALRCRGDCGRSVRQAAPEVRRGGVTDPVSYLRRAVINEVVPGIADGAMNNAHSPDMRRGNNTCARTLAASVIRCSANSRGCGRPARDAYRVVYEFDDNRQLVTVLRIDPPLRRLPVAVAVDIRGRPRAPRCSAARRSRCTTAPRRGRDHRAGGPRAGRLDRRTHPPP